MFILELLKEHMMGHSPSKEERSNSLAQMGSPDEIIIGR